MVVTVHWQYQADGGDGWKTMPDFYSQLHEQEYQASAKRFEYDVPYAKGTKSYHYIVNFEAMTQTNERKGTVRKIRRWALVPIPSASARAGTLAVEDASEHVTWLT